MPLPYHTMKMTEVTLHKEIKVGMPNYSNVTTGLHITWQLDENEVFEFDNGWDVINKQLTMQANDIDPSWLKSGETKNQYKATIRVPKQQTL